MSPLRIPKLKSIQSRGCWNVGLTGIQLVFEDIKSPMIDTECPGASAWRDYPAPETVVALQATLRKEFGIEALHELIFRGKDMHSSFFRGFNIDGDTKMHQLPKNHVIIGLYGKTTKQDERTRWISSLGFLLLEVSDPNR